MIMNKPKLTRSLAIVFLVYGWCVACVAQESYKSAIAVETIDGKKFDAAVIDYDAAAGVIRYMREPATTVESISCKKLTNAAMGRSAMKMTVIAQWLPENASKLVLKISYAQSLDEQNKCLNEIYLAGTKSTVSKEKLSYLQLYGIAFQLLDAEKSLNAAIAAQVKAEKQANREMQDAIEWVRRNRYSPLTGEDRGPRHMEFAKRRVAEIVAKPRADMLRAKSRFMMRLASTQAYAIHCGHLNLQSLSDVVMGLRAIVLKRSIVGQELRQAGDAILGWLITRCLLHHYQGDDETIFVRSFGKMFVDAQVDQAFEMLFFDFSDARRAVASSALKGALVALSEGRVERGQIVSGAAQASLLKILSRQSPELKEATQVVDRIMPFLEEAVRMSSQ